MGLKTFIIILAIFLLPFSHSFQITSENNSIAQEGSMWIELNNLHFVVNSEEFSLGDFAGFGDASDVYAIDVGYGVEDSMIVNNYTHVRSHILPGDDFVVVDNVSGFSSGDKVLLHQTQTGRDRDDESQSDFVVVEVDTVGTTGQNGSSAENAAVSCLDIKTSYPSASSGVYWISDGDLSDSSNAYQVYCNMDYDGGGWVLMDNFISVIDEGSTPYSVALGGNAIDSAADLDAAGWTVYLNNYGHSSYTRVSGYLQMFYSSSPQGYIQKTLPSRYDEIYVKWGNWYDGSAMLDLLNEEGTGLIQYLPANYGADETFQHSLRQVYSDYVQLRFRESGIFWVGEIWLRKSQVNAFTTKSNIMQKFYSQTGIDEDGARTTNGEITQAITIPQYDNLTIQEGSSIYPKTWDGYSGGIVVMQVNGTLTNAGTISADGDGFRGGRDAGLSGCASGEGEQGESYNGYGICGGYSGTSGYLNNNGGGGVCVNGAGGGYVTEGVDAQNYDGGECGAGEYGNGGNTYGSDSINMLHMGSGGAGGHNNGGTPNGGNGGGVVYIMARDIINTGTISSNGDDGWYRSSQGLWASGGGSGGTIHLTYGSLSNSGTISIEGGTDAPGTNAVGGDGGTGRIYYHPTESSATPGSIWIEGNSLMFVDDENIKHNLIGEFVSSQPSITSGTFWIDDTSNTLNYIDESNNHREIQFS